MDEDIIAEGDEEKDLPAEQDSNDYSSDYPTDYPADDENEIE